MSASAPFTAADFLQSKHIPTKTGIEIPGDIRKTESVAIISKRSRGCS